MLKKIRGGRKYNRVLVFFLALLMAILPILKPSVVSAEETVIYKQVYEFTEGKEYILAAEDETVYQAVYNATVGLPVEAAGALDIEVTEDGFDYHPAVLNTSPYFIPETHSISNTLFISCIYIAILSKP
jgi:hypothetical protein